MFNKNNSAYGRGIAANLVSEEERQRFNYGGRVGYANTGFVAPLYPSGVTPTKLGGTFEERQEYKKIKNLPPINLEEEFKEWYEIPELASPDPMAAIYGGGTYAPKSKFDEQEYIEEGPEQFKERFDVWKTDQGQSLVEKKKERDLIKAKVFGAQEDKLGKTQLEIDADEAEGAQTKGPPVDTTQLDTEELYSPQEQKEKKSQMALAIAGRLIGGSRDKWGSKAQMENIKGGLEDIRKIADPSERREMLAKYEAWGKARTKETLASLREQQKISKQATQEAIKDKEAQYTALWTSGKIDKHQAANRVYFDDAITTISDADKKTKKDWEKNPEKYPVVYDADARVYRFKYKGANYEVNLTELIKYRKKGII